MAPMLSVRTAMVVVKNEAREGKEESSSQAFILLSDKLRDIEGF